MKNAILNNFRSYCIFIFSYENDTNEVRASYHDDCLEKINQQQQNKTKKKKKKKKKKNIFCILNWGMAVSCSRNMNFVKCRGNETNEEKVFNV